MRPADLESPQALGSAGPRFDQPLASRGYAFWRLEALSDDRREALTLTMFIGSVFSPWYFQARRSPEGGRPEDFPAMHIGLHGARGARRAFTEYAARHLDRTAHSLTIARNSAHWRGDCLEVRLRELTAPLPSVMRGSVRFYPQCLPEHCASLDPAGLHRWRPIAPRGRVQVVLEEPQVRWVGAGYLDSHVGDEPLESTFRDWHGCRSQLRDGAIVTYECTPLAGPCVLLGFKFEGRGEFCELPVMAVSRLPRTHWRLTRRMRADAGSSRVLTTLEDTPCYARSVLAAQLHGESVTAVHESVSFERLGRTWVRSLLPLRMRRVRS